MSTKANARARAKDIIETLATEDPDFLESWLVLGESHRYFLRYSAALHGRVADARERERAAEEAL
jgi:hypothetical protein